MTIETTHRFADRVDNYVKYRPHYPQEMFDHLLSQHIISKNSVIADIGSGTGISTEPFLRLNLKVFAIEPNKEMRDAAEKLLGGDKNFHSVNATAEKTSLNDHSVDVIVAGQAFHWFDKERTKQEFKRILKPNGYVVLLWNDRRTNSTAAGRQGGEFLRSYEDLLQLCGTDYKEVNHKNTQDKKIFDSFFGENNYTEKWFDNFQEVDFAGLKGRVLSSSYMPNEGHKDYEHMLYCLKKVFARCQQNNTVRLEYDTKIYYGKL
ncbi:MAG: class I SAM-dependent methyltransferase [Sphingobacteriaceae bacterium]|nr:class I SAM-dependent methyltransferase [Sphingobacteriaceae bacterium]MBK7818450.1 class I SAM-dependent methyltransferase [Sphingobacteriaceae bacterium]